MRARPPSQSADRSLRRRPLRTPAKLHSSFRPPRQNLESARKSATPLSRGAHDHTIGIELGSEQSINSRATVAPRVDPTSHHDLSLPERGRFGQSHKRYASSFAVTHPDTVRDVAGAVGVVTKLGRQTKNVIGTLGGDGLVVRFGHDERRTIAPKRVKVVSSHGLVDARGANRPWRFYDASSRIRRRGSSGARFRAWRNAFAMRIRCSEGNQRYAGADVGFDRSISQSRCSFPAKLGRFGAFGRGSEPGRPGPLPIHS